MLALECRRRVKEQQSVIGSAEFGKVDLSYRIDDGPENVVFCEETVRHRMRMESEHDLWRRRQPNPRRRSTASS